MSLQPDRNLRPMQAGTLIGFKRQAKSLGASEADLAAAFAPDGAADPAAPEGAVRDPDARAAAERYCLGLFTSESGEALKDAGDAMCFGLDTPHAPDLPETAREHLVHEFGDVLAAIEFACLHGVIDRAGVEAARDRKLGRLCDPANRDHMGRPLAPRPIRLGAGEAEAGRPEGVARFTGVYNHTDGLMLMADPGGSRTAMLVTADRAAFLICELRITFPGLPVLLEPGEAVPMRGPAGTLRYGGCYRRGDQLFVVVCHDDGPGTAFSLIGDNAVDLIGALQRAFPGQVAAAVLGDAAFPAHAVAARAAATGAAPQPAQVRARVVTSRRVGSEAVVAMERDGEPFDLVLDFETGRDLQGHLAACFPNFAG